MFPAATPLEFPFRRWEMTGEEPPRRAPMQERKRKEREPEAPVPSAPTDEKVAAPPASAIAPQPFYRIFSLEPRSPTEGITGAARAEIADRNLAGGVFCLSAVRRPAGL